MEVLIKLAAPRSPLAADAGAVLCAVAGDASAATSLASLGAAAAAVALAAPAAPPAAARAGLALLARLADAAPGAAAAIVDAHGAESLATLLLASRAAAHSKEHTDWENAAYTAIARLALVEAFAEALQAAGGVAPLVAAAADEIPTVRSAAAHALACLAAHKRLRPELVRRRCLQLFVSLAAQPRSRRKDLADCQRVGALGLANLTATYHFRAAAAKAGALDAVAALLRSGDPETRRTAANAAASLALHEENGRRLCFGGALPPLLLMARSGERAAELAAVTALSALAINPENREQLIREGGLHALQYLANSGDARAAGAAKAVLSRMRVARLRAAARLAGQVAVQAARMRGEGGGGSLAPPTAEARGAAVMAASKEKEKGKEKEKERGGKDKRSKPGKGGSSGKAPQRGR